MITADYRVNRVILSSYATASYDYALFVITFGEKEEIIAVISAGPFLDASSTISDIYVIGGDSEPETRQSIIDKWHGDYEMRWRGFAPVRSFWDAAGVR